MTALSTRHGGSTHARIWPGGGAPTPLPGHTPAAPATPTSAPPSPHGGVPGPTPPAPHLPHAGAPAAPAATPESPGGCSRGESPRGPDDRAPSPGGRAPTPTSGGRTPTRRQTRMAAPQPSAAARPNGGEPQPPNLHQSRCMRSGGRPAHESTIWGGANLTMGRCWVHLCHVKLR